MRARALLVACAAVMALAACGGDTAEVVHLYDRTPVPAVPDRTMAISTPLADGDYWAPSAMADAATDRITFTLTQALFGPTCEAELGAAACPDDLGTIEQPQATIGVQADALHSVSVAGSNRQNFAITGTELVHLLTGGSPAGEAPPDFSYSPYPFLVTVRAGVVEVARQIWTA